MDSDQSEELFSDDDNLENIGDSSVKFPEVDPCSYARPINNYSPYQVNDDNSAEVPTTPLSLIPHFSSVTPKWTSDMETPDADLEKRLAGPSNRDQNHHENQLNNQRVTNFSITKTPVPHDSPSSDEIIPGSQDKYKKKRRKRPSRRILTNISNNSYSDDDLHHSRNSQEFVNDRDSDEFSDDKLTPIKEYSIEERGDDSFREINKENRQSADINPAERIRQLRELQNSLRLSQKNNLRVIDIPESKFSEKFRALESNCQSFSQCQKNSPKKFYEKTGLISFSHMNQCDDDHDNNEDDDDDDEQNYLSRSISKLIDEPFHTPAENDDKDFLFNKTIGKIVDEPLDSQTQDVYENDDFLGFTQNSQETSKLKCFKHKDFIRLSKRWKILDGFCLNEIEQSKNLAQSYNKFYTNYLNEQFPIARKKMVDKYFEQKFSVTNILPVIKMSLKQWFNSASGKELFVSVNAVSRSEFMLLEDDYSEHSIDNLLVNNFKIEESDIASQETVLNDVETNNSHKLRRESSTNKNSSDEVFNGSSSTTIKMSPVHDVNIKDESCNTESNQSTQLIQRMEIDSNEIFNDDYGLKCDREKNKNASQENSYSVDYEEDSLTKKLETSDKNVARNQQVLANSLPSSSTADKIINLDEDSLVKGFSKTRGGIGDESKREEEPNLKDIPINTEVIGFQTGRGKRINVPETVLQKAKNMFADEEQMILDTGKYPDDFEFIQPLPTKRIDKKIYPNLTNPEYKIQNKNQSSSKTNFVSVDKNTENKNDKKNVGTLKNPPTIIGFQTGLGKNKKVPVIVSSKAKSIFSEQDLDDFSMIEKISTSCKKNSNVPDITLSVEKNIFADDLFGDSSASNISIGFKTGNGKNIKIPDNALLKAKQDLSEEIVLDEEINLEKIKNSNREKRCLETSIEQPIKTLNIDHLKKRKYREEETPVGRKRSKLGLDLQRRKLFDGIEEEDETLMKAAMEFDECNVNNCDRNFDKTKWQPVKSGSLSEAICPSSSNDITDEVLDSVAAFVMDETNEIGDKWVNNEDNYASRKLPRNRTSLGSFLYPEESDKVNESKSTKRARSYPGSSEPISVTIGNSKSPVKSPKHDSIPEELFFDTQFSQGGTITFTSEQLQEQRLAASLEQDNVILLKKRVKVKPITGSLLNLKRTSNRISLKNYLQTPPKLATFEDILEDEIDIQVMSINSSNAEKYQFDLTKYFGNSFMMSNGGGVPIGDGAMLIPNDDNLAGVDEFKKCFLASPGVDPSLLHNRWVENHYRWIVWKLASMERLKVSRKWSDKYLTPDRVMKQLKYRYDREIDRSERPALRRILEKDDAPTRRMVLCVSRVYEDNAGQDNKSKSIELTDGWYSIPAIVDYAMVPYINSGKVKEGTKLMIFGAELVNHDEGRHPLDVTDDVRLKIHTNSTRRARWDVKLGYQQQSGPIPVNLTGIKSNGGTIGKFTVAVARVYPVLFREKIANGQSIVRNARCEEKAAIAYERECQSRIESICYEAQQSSDSTSKSDLERRVKNNLPERRNVTTILKIKVADNNYSATLTVWSCDEELQSIFKENTCIVIYNSLAAGKKMNELHITAGRSTIFERATFNRDLMCSSRIFTSLDEVLLPGFNPEYSEFDTVGVVVSVGPAPHGMKNFETVNIAYKKQDDEDSPSFYLSILFWKGVSSHGFAEIATVGAFLACINLEWRKNTYRSIPTAFCTERTLLTRNPRQVHLRQPFDLFCKRIQDISSYIESSSSIIQSQIEKKSGRSTPGFNTPSINSDHKRSSNSWTPENTDYSLVNPDSVPRHQSKKKAILSRLEKLQRYGEAPELSPIHLGQSSRVSLDYRSPVAQLPKSTSNT